MRTRLERIVAAITRWLTKELAPERSWLRWRLLMLVLAAVVVAALGPLPALLTRHPSHGLGAAERLKATNDVRMTLVQALGGLALFGGLLFTARTFGLTRQGQLTDRYTKAVEQLGNKGTEVRLGGIYALERLMVDSTRDHPTILEVLTAFLREHAKSPVDAPPPESEPLPMPADTVAVARVIARRPPGRDERGPLDLHGCYLHGANLSRANLSRAFLFAAVLPGANLSRADLSGANLRGAILSPTGTSSLIDPGPDLFGAFVSYGDLSAASLVRALPSGADLSGANLSGANLSHADLSGARNLTREQLSKAASAERAALPGYLKDPS